ncbi:metallopeptidase family protein [Propionibacteriaceae bacterium Y2011]
MATRHRDLRGRGIRGPLARPNPWTGEPVPVPRPPQRGSLFDRAVTEAVARVRRHCPEAVVGVTIGVEEVPPPQAPWATSQVPLAAAVEATAGTAAQVVIYRRPLEHRAASRRGLRILVHRTLVEQLAALTGRSISDLDPIGFADEDDDD